MVLMLLLGINAQVGGVFFKSLGTTFLELMKMIDLTLGHSQCAVRLKIVHQMLSTFPFYYNVTNKYVPEVLVSYHSMCTCHKSHAITYLSTVYI